MLLVFILLLAPLAAQQAPSEMAAEQHRQGIERFQNGRYDEGLRLLESARRLDPRNPNLAYDLALALYLRGRYTSGLEALGRISPARRDAACFALLGALERASDHPKEAEAALRRAVQLDPANPSYVFDLGVSLLESNTVEAYRVFERAAARFPGNAKVLLGLGIALHMTGKSAEAEQQLARATRLEPDSGDLQAALAELYDGSGQQQKAREAYETALRLEPRNIAYRIRLGRLLVKLDQSDAARAAFELALAEDPRNPEALFELGRIATGSRNYVEAIRYLERAVSLAPGYADAHYQLSLAYQRAGNAAKAAEERKRFEELRKETKP